MPVRVFNAAYSPSNLSPLPFDPIQESPLLCSCYDCQHILLMLTLENSLFKISHTMEGASSQSSPKAEHSRSPKPNGDDAQILPPQTDGGFACWVQVLGSFALWMNTWGIINTYGAFQTTYETMLPQSPSQIAWIGSIQTFLLFFVGILSAPLMDVGRCRPLLVAGNFLVVFGLMMTRQGREPLRSCSQVSNDLSVSAPSIGS